MGVTIDEILVGDPPEAWEAAGYAVDDDGTCRIGQVRSASWGATAASASSAGRCGGTPPARLADGTLDGIPTTARATAPSSRRHPNGSALHRPRGAAHPQPGAHHGGPRLDRRHAERRAGQRHLRGADAPGVLPMGEVILELIGQIDSAGEGGPGSSGSPSPWTTWMRSGSAARRAPRQRPRTRCRRAGASPPCATRSWA